MTLLHRHRMLHVENHSWNFMRNAQICQCHMQAMRSDWVWKSLRLWVLLQVLKLSIAAVPASAVNLPSCENPTNGASSCGQGQLWDDVEKKCTPCPLDFYQDLTNHNCRECKPCSLCEDGWTSADPDGCPPERDTRCVELAPVLLPTTQVRETTSSAPGDRQAIRPQITITPEVSTAEYEVGDSVILECLSTGDPLPDVHWMKHADSEGLTQMKPSDINVSQAVYLIQKVQVSDSGEYVCRAENSAGYVEKSIVVNVTENVAPSDLPEISINVMELTVMEGQLAVFNCSSSGSHIGSYSVKWMRAGQPMPGMVSVSSGVLTFPVTRTEYSGQYYCVVQNNFIFIQETVTLYVLASQPNQEHKDDPYKTRFYVLLGTVVVLLLLVIFLVADKIYQRKKSKDQQNNKLNQNSNGNVIRHHQDETRIEVGDVTESNEMNTMLPTSTT